MTPETRVVHVRPYRESPMGGSELDGRERSRGTAIKSHFLQRRRAQVDKAAIELPVEIDRLVASRGWPLCTRDSATSPHDPRVESSLYEDRE